MMKKFRIGVLGAGHLGKFHINCIKQIENLELIGFYDTDADNAKNVEKEFNINCLSSYEELIEKADIVDIVTPTITHYANAVTALNHHKHVFVEKPIVATREEAQKLVALAKEVNVKVQVGHVERFNPAFLSVMPLIDNPMFIETHRLAMFNPRGNDVSVVLDLMIHDINIVLSVVKSPIKHISASGIPIVTQTPDIANARLEFENGCVANLTASRLSLKNMRKSRFFQKDAYISIDFLEKQTQVIRLHDTVDADNPFALVLDLGNGSKRQITIETPKIEPVNSIKMELETFCEAIANDSTPIVSEIDGYEALNVAYLISEEINKNLNR